MVERDLAKVEVAGSSPVIRSKTETDRVCGLFLFSKLKEIEKIFEARYNEIKKALAF